MKKINIRYFASLRDQRGIAQETVETEIKSAGALYDHIAAQNMFTLARDNVRVAINDEFASWDADLANGDAIVFIPPVAGG